MSKRDLTNDQWECLRPLLPPQKPKTGRPAADHRKILNGILWILRTGAPWRDLPECYGPWQTVTSRFYRWRKVGLWSHILDAIQRRADATRRLDWSVHYVDSTIVRAHQHAVGAQQGYPATEALGGSQGGFSPKVHLRADGGGKLMALVLTPGQQHEATVFKPLQGFRTALNQLASFGECRHIPRIYDERSSTLWDVVRLKPRSLEPSM